ncbi:hypothetical protein Golax_011191 [Gossypium laxum]|uniref:Uncharacterized protein n=1 Tax=Gossypium laxum TaxID=34288 RepID=A0A7J8ZJR2_9ROSI|nr:hypothetical protein [Gossypium laxum]
MPWKAMNRLKKHAGGSVLSFVTWVPRFLSTEVVFLGLLLLRIRLNSSSHGKPGPSGRGGVLRDASGNLKCLFSGPLGVLCSNSAELHAIFSLCFFPMVSMHVFGDRV